MPALEIRLHKIPLALTYEVAQLVPNGTAIVFGG